MAPAPKDLSEWRDSITQWLCQDRLPQSEVLERLAAGGSKVCRGTLNRWLTRWEIRTAPKAGQNETPELHERIAAIFKQGNVTDREMRAVLAREGFDGIPVSAVARIRRSMNLRKRVFTDQDIEAAEEHIRQALRVEFDHGKIEDLGKGLLHAYMRTKYNTIGRDRTYRIAKEIYPEGPARRRPRHKAHRGEGTR